MMAVVVALAAAAGAYYLYTAVALGWRGVAVGPGVRGARRRRDAFDQWLAQAGLADVDRREFVVVIAALAALGALAGWALFGAAPAALALGGFAASFPIAGHRHRREQRRAAALEAWPRLIEEIRLLTASTGRSIPQALLEVGARGPVELRPAFAAAQREWLLSTDFERCLDELKHQLADPTADMVCETLLIAHRVGGADLPQRLDALAVDRRQDLHARKDARSRQAGARFARRFVLIVPFGMALAGMSVGTGRDAYATPTGQVLVLVALAMVVVCWVWAGRLMRLPDERRVFQGLHR